MHILPFALPHGQARHCRNHSRNKGRANGDGSEHGNDHGRFRPAAVARELAGLTGLVGWLGAVLYLVTLGAARLF